jgi:hypothetical protein
MPTRIVLRWCCPISPPSTRPLAIRRVDGFRTELYNSRGAHWVDPTGASERELATKYRAQAEAVEQAGYHRVATILRELAASYEREGDRLATGEHFGE